MFITAPYADNMKFFVWEFLEKAFAESGKTFELHSRHNVYVDISGNFRLFYVLVEDNARIVGTVGVRDLGDGDCELKALYLLKEFHGTGHGKKLLELAIGDAKVLGYKRMFLDSKSEYEKAIALYRKAGFVDTEKYNDNDAADVFMVLDLAGGDK